MSTNQTRRKDKGLPGNGGQYTETEHAAVDEVSLFRMQQAIEKDETVKEAVDAMLDEYLDPSPKKLDKWAEDWLPQDATPAMKKTAVGVFQEALAEIDHLLPQIMEKAQAQYAERNAPSSTPRQWRTSPPR